MSSRRRAAGQCRDRAGVQDATEDELGCGCRGIRRVADQIAEVVLAQTIRAENARRMQEHDTRATFDCLEYGCEVRIRQRAPGDVGLDLDPRHAALTQDSLDLGHREIRALHRHDPERPEAIGVCRRHALQMVVHPPMQGCYGSAVQIAVKQHR